MALDRVQKGVLEKVAKKHGLSTKDVEDIYVSAFSFVRDTASELDVITPQTNGELHKLKSNFNIPGLGKFHLNVHKVMADKISIKKYKSNNKNKDE